MKEISILLKENKSITSYLEKIKVKKRGQISVNSILWLFSTTALALIIFISGKLYESTLWNFTYSFLFAAGVIQVITLFHSHFIKIIKNAV